MALYVGPWENPDDRIEIEEATKKNVKNSNTHV